MIASEEIIVPHAGQGISDSPPEASSWTTALATGFGTWAATAGAEAAIFGACEGTAAAGAGWGRTAASCDVFGDGLGRDIGAATVGAEGGAVLTDCSCARICFSFSISRLDSSAILARVVARLSSSAASFLSRSINP